MTWFRSHKPIVMCFHADGCMAHDHQFQWIGEIVGHKPASVVGAPDGTYTAAIVKIHKRRNDPAHWTKGEYARDAQGNGMLPWLLLREPVCYCALGATFMASDSLLGRALSPNTDQALNALQRHVPNRSAISFFNDDPKTTHAEVLAMFDKAIEEAGA